MISARDEKKSENHEPVIVRGFSDKPVRLTAVSVRDGAVETVGADEAQPMPFRVDRVYRFSPDLYSDLRSAYEKGDRGRLERLWDRAEFFAHERRSG